MDYYNNGNVGEGVAKSSLIWVIFHKPFLLCPFHRTRPLFSDLTLGVEPQRSTNKNYKRSGKALDYQDRLRSHKFDINMMHLSIIYLCADSFTFYRYQLVLGWRFHIYVYVISTNTQVHWIFDMLRPMIESIILIFHIAVSKFVPIFLEI